MRPLFRCGRDKLAPFGSVRLRQPIAEAGRFRKALRRNNQQPRQGMFSLRKRQERPEEVGPSTFQPDVERRGTVSKRRRIR